MELSFHHHPAFDAGAAPKADIRPPPPPSAAASIQNVWGEP
jgi:hypothetical protein